MLLLGDDQRIAAGHLVVVVRVGGTHQDGAFLQVEVDVAAQVDAAGQVAAHPETEGATALLRNPVDGFLYGTGVHSDSVAADAELGSVVNGVLRGKGTTDEEEEQEGDGRFFHCNRVDI